MINMDKYIQTPIREKDIENLDQILTDLIAQLKQVARGDKEDV